MPPAQKTSPDLSRIWRKGLLDAFLTTWIPDCFVRDQEEPYKITPRVPMSAWPSVAWKLAQRKEEGLVAHSLLCLTLAVLGVRTNDPRLTMEASRHYGWVLHQFQRRVAMLAQSNHPRDRDEQIAALVASGFCCSQVEYILRSWMSGDRHLQGVETLLQDCSPSFTENEDYRMLCYDHCFLWTSCSVTHRRRNKDLPWLWHDKCLENSLMYRNSRRGVTLSEAIASLLQDYDVAERYGLTVDLIALRQEFARAIFNNEAFYHRMKSAGGVGAEYSKHDECGWPSPELNPQLLSNSMLRCYTSALQIHAVATAWKIVRSCGELSATTISGLCLTEDQLQLLCEYHISEVRHSIAELGDERYGMITVSLMLHLIEAAWVGYTALAEHCGHDLTESKGWFMHTSAHVANKGYRPLREPWIAL